MAESKGRWQGRNDQKDQLRRKIWRELEDTGTAVGDPWSAIPDFQGADQAANNLAELAIWEQATVVKCNPDRAQGWIRLKALQTGKRVYTPIPELTAGFPFLLLDPATLARQGMSPSDVMYSAGAMKYGQPVHFEDMEIMDLCVVGSVAVSCDGRRTGKGAGFADLEMGIFRELGILPASTPVITSVSEVQVIDEGFIPMEEHDTPLDWIITPERTIETKTHLQRPTSMDWDRLQPDQYETIPFLKTLELKMKPARG